VPILPVFTYTNADDIIQKINDGERPLTMYIYNKDTKWNEHIIKSTRSGSVCINHNVVHFFNTDLPFGGINNSGTGRSHGRAGFEGFSDRRAIFKQNWAFAGTKLIYPPYTNLKKRLINFLIKWV
jgi:aldehyde dehydrogenase (NAD+)